MITPSNVHLPPQTTSFIGRTDEIIRIAQRLSEPDCHLLTLVGPGGIGKTRLAIEVAKHLVGAGLRPVPADGIHFVDLQPVPSPDLLVTTLADVIGLRFFGEQPPRIQLLNYLRDRDILLVIDNFEHLLDAVDLLIDIVKIAPNVKLLVTSREALNVREEWLWKVEGLQVPGDVPVHSMDDYSAVRMFVERARHVRADFAFAGQEEEVAHICQLVGGMPLALELAASWTRALSCVEIANEIQHGLDFLKTTMRNMPERHRSMRAVFDLSWGRLTDEERAVFPQLSVFRGGFRREAAEMVTEASLSTLVGLVDKSLLRANDSGRYEIHELLRQYGEEKLIAEPGAQEAAHERHCAYFARFMHHAWLELKGQGHADALNRIAADLDNVRACWQWAVEKRKEPELRFSMHSLLLFCHIRGKGIEGERAFDLAIQRLEPDESALLAYLLLARLWLAEFNGRAVAVEEYPRAIQLLSTFGADEDIVMPLWGYRFVRGKLLADGLFDDERQRAVYQNLLDHFKGSGQCWGTGWMLLGLGNLCVINEKWHSAERYFRKSEPIFKQMGNRYGYGMAILALAELHELWGKYHEAHPLYQEVMAINQEYGDVGIVLGFASLARVALHQQNYRDVTYYVAQGVKVHLETHSLFRLIGVLFQVFTEALSNEARWERAVEMLAFLQQYAGRVGGSRFAEEAEQRLRSWTSQLPAEVFQKAVERGKRLDLKTILAQLLEELSESLPVDTSSIPLGQHLIDPLSERELEVLRLIAAGLKNQEIAEQLVIVVGTVKAHISAIYRKLDVASRVQAVSRARALKIL